MNVSGSKNRATLRRSGQRRDVPKSFNFNVAIRGQCRDVTERLDLQRHDVQANVTTFPRGVISTSRRCRGVYFNVLTLESNVVTLQSSMLSTLQR